MIDIHCHLLHGVDDGPEKIELSIAMLQFAKEQGVTDIILTPHYRRGMFKFDGDLVKAQMIELAPYAEEIGIKMHLGTEVHVNGDILEYIESHKVFTLADSEYVLTEYGYDTEYAYIFKNTHELLRHGYIPVIAHVERYACLVKNPKRLEELQEIGAWIQCNAAAIIGEEGWGTKQFCKKALKHGWVDVVASDSHDKKKRKCYMEDAYDYITEKYGEKLAYRLMIKNPKKIICEA